MLFYIIFYELIVTIASVSIPVDFLYLFMIFELSLQLIAVKLVQEETLVVMLHPDVALLLLNRL